MRELRCKNEKCNKLLAKIEKPHISSDETVKVEYTTNKILKVEVKCSRCKELNIFKF